MKKILGIIIAAAALTLSGCANEAPETTGTVNTVTQYDGIIDVRTFEEWNAGHLQGALLMSVEEMDFLAQIKTLDPEGDYYVYCRTGNRAGIAIDFMRENGFTGELVNGGSIENASEELKILIVK